MAIKTLGLAQKLRVGI